MVKHDFKQWINSRTNILAYASIIIFISFFTELELFHSKINFYFLIPYFAGMIMIECIRPLLKNRPTLKKVAIGFAILSISATLIFVIFRNNR